MLEPSNFDRFQLRQPDYSRKIGQVDFDIIETDRDFQLNPMRPPRSSLRVSIPAGNSYIVDFDHGLAATQIGIVDVLAAYMTDSGEVDITPVEKTDRFVSNTDALIGYSAAGQVIARSCRHLVANCSSSFLGYFDLLQRSPNDVILYYFLNVDMKFLEIVGFLKEIVDGVGPDGRGETLEANLNRLLMSVGHDQSHTVSYLSERPEWNTIPGYLALDVMSLWYNFDNVVKARKISDPSFGVYVMQDYDRDELVVELTDNGGGISINQLRHEIIPTANAFTPDYGPTQGGVGNALLLHNAVRSRGGQVRYTVPEGSISILMKENPEPSNWIEPVESPETYKDGTVVTIRIPNSTLWQPSNNGRA